MLRILTVMLVSMCVMAGSVIAAPITASNMASESSGKTPDQLPGIGGLAYDVLENRSTFVHGSLAMNIGNGTLAPGEPIAPSVLSTDFNPAGPVPEPASLLLLGVGMLSAGIFARKRKKSH